jgi:formate/nitrite transporter FocA (FNT family)
MSEDSSDMKKGEEVLHKQVGEGIEDFAKPDFQLFVSALTGGLEIGFSVLLIGLLHTAFAGQFGEKTLHFILALGYPLGFVFVVIGRSQLYTEQTSIAFLPVLDGKKSFAQLLKFWGVVLSGNLIGGLLFAFFISWIGPDLEVIREESFQYIANKLLKPDWWLIFGSALIAGWMMGLLGWLVVASQDTVSRIILIVLITFVIGFGGFHHCIVGSIELLCGLMTMSDVDILDYLRIMSSAITGNTIGGAIFVAGLKYNINVTR